VAGIGLPATIAYREGAPVALTSAVNAWLSSHASSKSSQTYAECLSRVTRIVPFSDLLSIGETEVRRIVDALAGRYSHATVVLTVRAMSSLWNQLLRFGLAQSNPWRSIRVKKPKDTLAERLLTEEEVARLIDAVKSDRDKAFLRFLFATGLRVAEAVSVTWDDLSWDEEDRCWLTVYGKGGKTRAVEVPGTVVGELVRLWRGRERTGRLWPFSVRTAQRLLEKARVAVGRPVSPHWLRHARATAAIRRGAPIHLVQRTLGHASPTTTMRYLHALPGESDAGFVPEL
jgi:integrase/recombinase XerD